jgi:Trypsin
VVAYIADTEHVDLATAQARANDETKAAPLGDELAAALPQTYGGIYSDANSRLTVLLVGNSIADQAVVSAVGARYHLSQAVQTASASYSALAMTSLAKSVEADLLARVPGESMVIGPDLATQSILVQVVPAGMTAARARATAVRSALQTHAAAAGTASSRRLPPITYRQLARSTTPHLTSCDLLGNCDAPLRGGVPLFTDSTGCTLGFNVQDNYTGAAYVLTAGHCLAAATLNNESVWETYQADGYPHIVGSSWITDYLATGEDGDSGLVGVNRPTLWNPQNWIVIDAGTGYGGAAAPATNYQYPITAVYTATKGTRVCFTGIGSRLGRGSECGYVSTTGVTIRPCMDNGQCVTIRNEALTNMPGAEGDSGGPVFANNGAWGIVSAGDASGHMYFVGTKQAEQDLHMTILTY